MEEENIENDNTTKWNVQDISLHFTINATRTTSTTVRTTTTTLTTTTTKQTQHILTSKTKRDTNTETKNITSHNYYNINNCSSIM